MQPVQKPVEVLQYKTNVGYFVKVNTTYSYDIFGGYIINGLTHEQVVKIKDYAKLDSEVVSVQNKITSKPKIVHFKLKDEELESSKLPLIVNHRWDDDFDKVLPEGVERYESLYEPVYEETEEQIVDVPFVVVNMGEYIIENPTNLKERKIRFSGGSSAWSNKVLEEELKNVVTYDDIVKLLTPEFAITQAPCKLTSYQMYRIVRQYLLENLNMKENVITSNYDFCFTVKKRVHTKPFVVTESYLAGRNKWKIKQVTNTEKLVEVFEMTYAGYKGTGGYDGYTCIPELQGDNLEDLSNKLDNYLDALVTTLNAKVNECECCCGTGHIIVKGEVK